MAKKRWTGYDGYRRKTLMYQDRGLRFADRDIGQEFFIMTYICVHIKITDHLRRVLQYKKRKLAWQITTDSQTPLL